MARRLTASFQRPSRQRLLGRRILIACEGEKTEYGYFEDVRKSLRMEPNKIIVLKPESSDPLGIVKQALEERTYRQQEKIWDEEDMAWAVFDGDEHKANNSENWRQALQIAQKKDIRLAISNPSFEYWYLLHYQDQTSYLTRQQALNLFKGHVPKYEKSDVLYREELQSRTAAAISRAQQVAHQAMTDTDDPYSNPCTHVWELVALILSLQKEARA